MAICSDLITLRREHNHTWIGYPKTLNYLRLPVGMQAIPTTIGMVKANELEFGYNVYHMSSQENFVLPGTLPTELGNMAALTVLFIHDMGIHGSIPSQLGKLTRYILSPWQQRPRRSHPPSAGPTV